MIKKIVNYFSKLELFLWLNSATLIISSFVIFGGNGILTLIASLIGVTAILLNAKGNPVGQILMIIFSLLYGIISYSFSYYGEMFTYLLMTMPMSVFALISWLKHPSKCKKLQVKVNYISKTETIIMFFIAFVVTFCFYFILKFFNTANIVPSTISVTTSFVAVYLTFRRNPYFNVAYACNDLVLIVLWTLASIVDKKYVSAIVCFVAFLFNDIYGFISWKKLKKEQTDNADKI